MPPRPPDLARHVLRELPLDAVFAHLNWQMLLGKHLGLRGSVRKLLSRDVRAEELAARVEALQDAAVGARVARPAGGVPLLPRRRPGRQRRLLDATSRAGVSAVPAADAPPHACAADWVAATARGDSVALLVTTAGAGVRERAAGLRDAGRLLDSIALQALAIETAEAAAEWLHRRLRALWGFPDPPEMTMEERLRARYRGIRLSFGYPACPDLEPQADLFRLLQPEEIGVRLTDELDDGPRGLGLRRRLPPPGRAVPGVKDAWSSDCRVRTWRTRSKRINRSDLTWARRRLRCRQAAPPAAPPRAPAHRSAPHAAARPRPTSEVATQCGARVKHTRVRSGSPTTSSWPTARWARSCWPGCPAGAHLDLAPLEYPREVLDIHLAYLTAGAELLETATFAASRPRLERLHAGDHVEAVNAGGASSSPARPARSPASTPWSAGSIGPLAGVIDIDEPAGRGAIAAAHAEQAGGAGRARRRPAGARDVLPPRRAGAGDRARCGGDSTCR